MGNRNQPLTIDYAFQAQEYGKNVGDMLMVRPRILGSESSSLLETSEPRKFAIEFGGPSRDSDNFEIVLPQGYGVTDITPPVDADFGFANYHSKTELIGNILHYVRTLKVREVSVSASKAAELKKFYRIIATDERNMVVLKRMQQAEAPSPRPAAK